MKLAIQNDLEAKRARKILLSQYRALKSWEAVRAKFGLSSKAAAYRMAHGDLKICDRMRDVVRMSGKRFFRTHVKKVAVPFLAARQRKSPTGRYGRGGRVIV